MNQSSAWSWSAFLNGPFWYISKGMHFKGLLLLIICIFTMLCAVPFVWIYCGAKAKSDWYNYQLSLKSKIDIEKL